MSDSETGTVTLAMDDLVLETALSWCELGEKAAIATVISTWGSAPRPAGSQLVIHESGKVVGSVSGGCIEGAVIHNALGVIVEGKPRTLEFGVSNTQAWEVGLACGGKINIFVEPLTS